MHLVLIVEETVLWEVVKTDAEWVEEDNCDEEVNLQMVTEEL